MARRKDGVKTRLFKINGWLWRIVFAAAGFIFGAGVAWGVVKTEIKGIAKTLDDHENRLRTVEKAVIKASTSLANIDRNVRDLKREREK